MFRRVLSTKRGVRLRKEAISYSRAEELIKRELRKEGLDPATFGQYTACVQKELQKQQPFVCQTASSRGMQAGAMRSLGTVT